MKIDFVIPWVDGSDPEWIKEKKQYHVEESSDNHENRYRDLENLKYWFRGVEKFAPWVNKIHFITWGHIPDWLDINHPKINVVYHEDFIPKKYLPTFNIRPIEINLHRIEELSENFVYFNDDTFIVKDMEPSDFFRKNLPVDIAILDAFSVREDHSYTALNNVKIINKHFDKKQVMKENKFKWFSLKYGAQLYRNVALYPWKYFTGFYTPHLPVAFKKSTFFEVWEEEEELLKQTSKSKFRTKEDISMWLMRFWRLAQGEFQPQKLSGLNYSISSKKVSEKAATDINNKKYQMVCLNDVVPANEFEEVKLILIRALDNILPDKSSFEK